MTELFDKEQFNTSIELAALRIPAKTCTEFMKLFKDYLFVKPRVKRIYPVEDDANMRLMLLDPSITMQNYTSSLPVSLQDTLRERGGSVEVFTMHRTYDDYSVEEAFKVLLPDNIEHPSAFEQIGHIAHLNLRDDALPHKYIIGAVILDKIKILKTVVNKTGNIATQFRTFPMELLAGTGDYEVTVRESGAQFKFNFADVLSTEHGRLIELITPSTTGPAVKRAKKSNSDRVVVADMMAGVGPFAVPLAMNGALVYANDLNPKSYEYLLTNRTLNHCQRNLHCYNMDGREFISSICGQGVVFHEVIMNLPQTAVEFLDVFIGIRRKFPNSFPPDHFPRIHVHGFTTDEIQPIADFAARAASIMKCTVDDLGFDASAGNDQCFGHVVRDVAPKKVMVCLSFRLPECVVGADVAEVEEEKTT